MADKRIKEFEAEMYHLIHEITTGSIVYYIGKDELSEWCAEWRIKASKTIREFLEER